MIFLQQAKDKDFDSAENSRAFFLHNSLPKMLHLAIVDISKDGLGNGKNRARFISRIYTRISKQPCIIK
jgi:hypothetical protein